MHNKVEPKFDKFTRSFDLVQKLSLNYKIIWLNFFWELNPKTYDMPPFLVAIGQWGCVEWWLKKYIFSLFSIQVQGLNP